MGKWYTEEEKHRAVNMRLMGINPETIAKTLGNDRSAQSVRNILSKARRDFPKLKRKNNKYDSAYVEAWERRWTEGETLTAIAKKENVSVSFVSQKIAAWFHNELV